jgi:1-phosphofructokinase
MTLVFAHGHIGQCLAWSILRYSTLSCEHAGMSDALRFATLTLSPAFDCTVQVDGELCLGGVHRVASEHRVPGGKGLNVASMLALNGCAVTVGGLLGDADSQEFDAGVAPGIGRDFMQVPHATRQNVMLTDDAGRELKLNRVGYPDLAFEWDPLREYVERLARDASVVVMSGGLPAQFPVDTYARLTERVKGLGKRVVLDAAGPLLAAALDATPALIKPNREELSAAVGDALESESELAAAMASVAQKDITVIVSDGPDGAYFADGSAIWHASAPRVKSVDSTGAGDALLGQFCADYFGKSSDMLEERTMARAVAAGAACVEVYGPVLGELARVEELAGQVRVRPL